ncbi:DYNLL [Mytilus edulis]|uniref:Dynein light chain 1, cytoplasmic n=1 Tax=Mytilus edulis TaxID=6550 RepID=A0A8S3Q6G4_MYTED|nr:DYNLL [Mytilus edulis]
MIKDFCSCIMSDRKAVVKNADMSEDMQQDVVDCSTQALEKFNIEKDIAAYIKKEFDRKYNPTWHCNGCIYKYTGTTVNVTFINNYSPNTLRSKQQQLNDSNIMTERKAVIKNADMSEDMQQDAVESSTQALEKFNIEKDIAAFIKKDFDKKYNPTWHCIVGRNFGSYVTHESKHFIYFYMGQVAILLFKSG